MALNDLPYRVGGLLYIPALKEGVAEHIRRGDYPNLTSVVFCLEDSIMDEAVEEAEKRLKRTFGELCAVRDGGGKLPLIFVRPRSPRHMDRLVAAYRDVLPIIDGFVLPKFTFADADEYRSIIEEINAGSKKKIYLMPIIESPEFADCANRRSNLIALKEKIDAIKDYILNIRVGGNDFSNLFGVRRTAEHTVYDIGIIRDILTDILNTFSRDYVVSGPVYEYFENGKDEAWRVGLKRELVLDRLNGFIGKTCIHPSQLCEVYNSLKVSREDYEDAMSILDWDDKASGVSKSAGGNRMNERKCHRKWAEKICILAGIYGIVE